MSRKLTMWAALAALLAGFCVQQAIAQEESYTGVVQTLGPAGAGATQTKFTVQITKWASQDEIKQLGQLLKEKGQSALLEEMNKLNAGKIYRTGDTGNEIALAEKSQNGGDTIITMISARRMSMFETNAKGTSTKYPFAFLQFTVNSNGEGTGKLVEAAAIRYDQKQGTYSLDPYGQGARVVNNVKREK